jgi:hypothetical protein
MKPQNKIFKLKEPSSEFMTQWNEKRTYYHTVTVDGNKTKLHIDDGHRISFGGIQYHALWKYVDGKFIQSDVFYANGLAQSNLLISKNEILAQMITHVLPDKFVNKVIEFAQRF